MAVGGLLLFPISPVFFILSFSCASAKSFRFLAQKGIFEENVLDSSLTFIEDTDLQTINFRVNTPSFDPKFRFEGVCTDLNRINQTRDQAFRLFLKSRLRLVFPPKTAYERPKFHMGVGKIDEQFKKSIQTYPILYFDQEKVSQDHKIVFKRDPLNANDFSKFESSPFLSDSSVSDLFDRKLVKPFNFECRSPDIKFSFLTNKKIATFFIIFKK